MVGALELQEDRYTSLSDRFVHITIRKIGAYHYQTDRYTPLSERSVHCSIRQIGTLLDLEDL